MHSVMITYIFDGSSYVHSSNDCIYFDGSSYVHSV